MYTRVNHVDVVMDVDDAVQLVQQQALMASMVTQCPGNALFNPAAPAMQGVAATQTATPHVAPAPAYSAPVITASSSGNVMSHLDIGMSNLPLCQLERLLNHFIFY